MVLRVRILKQAEPNRVNLFLFGFGFGLHGALSGVESAVSRGGNYA